MISKLAYNIETTVLIFFFSGQAALFHVKQTKEA